MNLLSYKSQINFLTIVLRVIMAICRATRKIRFLTMAIRRRRTDDAGLSCLLSKVTGSNYIQL